MIQKSLGLYSTEQTLGDGLDIYSSACVCLLTIWCGTQSSTSALMEYDTANSLVPPQTKPGPQFTVLLRYGLGANISSGI